MSNFENLLIDASTINDEVFADVESIGGWVLNLDNHDFESACKHEGFQDSFLARSNGVRKSFNSLTKKSESILNWLCIVLLKELNSTNEIIDNSLCTFDAPGDIINSDTTSNSESYYRKLALINLPFNRPAKTSTTI